MTITSYNLVVIGVGGTGTFFTKEVSRFLRTYHGNMPVQLILIDGDKVEDDNLSRQAFSEFDVEQNKAVTFASAVKDSFGIEAYAYPLYLDEKKDLDAIMKESNYYHNSLPILIGCVDNHRARQVLHSFFSETKNCIYIDAANEFSKGEVVIGAKMNGKVIAPDRAHYFPGILKSRGKRASEQSCGAINKHSPQHICTNMLAANICLSKVTNFLQTSKLETGIVYFDAFRSEMISVPYEGGEDSADAESVKTGRIQKSKKCSAKMCRSTLK